MLEETATVVATEGTTLWVETQSRSGCTHCSSSTQCTTSVLSQLFGVRRNRLALNNHLDAKNGDQVIIGIPDGLLVRASLWGYLLPLLAMVGLAVAGHAGGLNEGLQSLLAVAGLSAGLYIVNRLTYRQGFKPELLRIAGRGKMWLGTEIR